MNDQEEVGGRKNENPGAPPQPTSPAGEPPDVPPWAGSDRPGCAALAAQLALQADTVRERAAWYVVAATASVIDRAALAATDAAMTVAQIVDHVSQRGDAERRWRAERFERWSAGVVSVAAPMFLRMFPRAGAADASSGRGDDGASDPGPTRPKKAPRRPEVTRRSVRRG